jgi:hypothetical protein
MHPAPAAEGLQLWLELKLDVDMRVTILEHVRRGGAPSA